METYISILRGINVSGHRKIEIASLKKLYQQQGFKDVVTYIQSGNVIFKTDEKTRSGLAETISKAIFEQYQFEVPVIVRTRSELDAVISGNPFLSENDIDPEKLHITFLSHTPDRDKINIIEKLDFLPDRFILTSETLYLYCPAGYGNTKLSNTFFENKLKVTATTRNWKTVNKLFQLATGEG